MAIRERMAGWSWNSHTTTGFGSGSDLFSRASFVNADRYGNTASTTHTVALVEELEAGRIAPGDKVALLALASGLEIGVVLLTLDEELVSRYGHRH